MNRDKTGIADSSGEQTVAAAPAAVADANLTLGEKYGDGEIRTRNTGTQLVFIDITLHWRSCA